MLGVCGALLQSFPSEMDRAFRFWVGDSALSARWSLHYEMFSRRLPLAVADRVEHINACPCRDEGWLFAPHGKSTLTIYLSIYRRRLVAR